MSGKGSGCQQCDGRRCQQCWEGYALDASGACVRCTTDTPSVRCLACDPAQPAKCLKCEGEGKGGEPGTPAFYASAEGLCTACAAANCTVCDGAGVCTKCAAGHTWFNGTCGEAAPACALLPDSSAFR